MPLRQGKSKLWFKTKEEQDEFDDNMISSVSVQSQDFDSDDFTPIFRRDKKQFYVALTDKSKQDLARFADGSKNPIAYIDKHLSGKRDHTFNREWTIQKFSVGYGVSYLLLRELPIRNFYARAWIMLCFLTKYFYGTLQPIKIASDPWTDKDIKNFRAYKDNRVRMIPSLDNRIPQYRLWQLNQPGYLRDTPQRFLDTGVPSYFRGAAKQVAWDGTWNMPLEGLAHPKHKDAKYVDFVYQ